MGSMMTVTQCSVTHVLNAPVTSFVDDHIWQSQLRGNEQLSACHFRPRRNYLLYFISHLVMLSLHGVAFEQLILKTESKRC